MKIVDIKVFPTWVGSRNQLIVKQYAILYISKEFFGIFFFKRQSRACKSHQPMVIGSYLPKARLVNFMPE